MKKIEFLDFHLLIFLISEFQISTKTELIELIKKGHDQLEPKKVKFYLTDRFRNGRIY